MKVIWIVKGWCRCRCIFCQAKISSDPVKVEDFKELAKLALPKVYYDFYAGGAEDEHTLRDNIQAFQRIT